MRCFKLSEMLKPDDFEFSMWTKLGLGLGNINMFRNKHNLINPFPPVDAFWRKSSRRLLKKMWPKRKLLMMSNFSFGHNVFNFIKQLSYLLWIVFMFLSLCFQSHLQQICCMWERVNNCNADINPSPYTDNIWAADNLQKCRNNFCIERSD